MLGTHYNFWEETGNSRKKMWNHLALVLGCRNLWIFHLSYGRFGLYLLINLLNICIN